MIAAAIVAGLMLLALIAWGVWACRAAINHQTSMMRGIDATNAGDRIVATERLEDFLRSGDWLSDHRRLAEHYVEIRSYLGKAEEYRADRTHGI